MDDKNTLLKSCRYYKGEEDSPFNDTDIRYTAWRIERLWVKLFNDDNSDFILNCLTDYNLHGMGDYRKADDTPITLKAVLMNRFFQYSGREVLDNFKNFYERLYPI